MLQPLDRWQAAQSGPKTPLTLEVLQRSDPREQPSPGPAP